MNLLDALILVLLGLSLVAGFRRGAAMQLIAYAALLVGLVVGAIAAPPLAGIATDPLAQTAIALGALLSIAALFDAAGWAIGRRVWAAARGTRLGVADAWAGSLVGMVAILLTVWFLAFNLVQGPFPWLSGQIRGSTIVRGIDAALPRPPPLLAQVRGFLGRFGFPEVFADLPPAPAGPVRGPTAGEVGGAVRAADQSTLLVQGQACGRIQEGSGFVVADGYAVTNAHVVAGVDAPAVRPQGGASIPAATVLFDPALDLAVLRLESAPAVPLRLRETDLDRGDPGAVLGYPGGGPLRAEPAAVRRVLTAIGRDIYGRGTVAREVYELQTAVSPGSSGGPFVGADGEVAGVVFAASTASDGVGYALTSSEVAPPVRRAIGRTAAVGTGPCLR